MQFTLQPGSCWLDLYRDLAAATKFIYIGIEFQIFCCVQNFLAGWAVWTELVLVRGEDRELLLPGVERELSHLTLGQLLK